MNPEFSPPQYGWGRKWFRRGPPRAVVMELPAVLRVFLSKNRICIKKLRKVVDPASVSLSPAVIGVIAPADNHP